MQEGMKIQKKKEARRNEGARGNEDIGVILSSCACGKGMCEDIELENAPYHAEEEVTNTSDIRHNWSLEEIENLFALPMMDLIYRAQKMHREYHNPNHVQLSTLLNIKTGGCSQDCKYCAQSAYYAKTTGIKASKLMRLEVVLKTAKRAKELGAQRFCMGAAWRDLKARDLKRIGDMVEGVKAVGLETCMTLGMLTQKQADYLAERGLDYYNHNLDTSKEHYAKIITTRSYQERLDTLEAVRRSGIHVCSGGIVGLGEERKDRAELLRTLANLTKHPASVPINMLVPVKGTPMEHMKKLDTFEFLRTIAVARLVMPKAYVRLSAGRKELSDEAQALAFQCGANSIFYGDTLLTTENPAIAKDMALFQTLGINAM